MPPATNSSIFSLGLCLLAAEFIWARQLMDRIRQEGGRVRDAVWKAKN